MGLSIWERHELEQIASNTKATKEILEKILEILNKNQEYKNNHSKRWEENNLMSFIKDQTKLMVDYAYYYQGKAKDFVPDVNYTKLKESINSLKSFDEDLVFKIQQIYSEVESDR